jgi:hypothetical protein
MKISYVFMFCLLSLLAWSATAIAMDGVIQPDPGADTPEPATVVLVGVGLVAGGFAVWRSRRRQQGADYANSKAPGGFAD